MGKNTNTIEINGRRYDASTGAILDVFAPTSAAKAPRPATPKMDITPSPKPKPATVQAAAKLKPAPRHHDIKRQPAKKLSGHAPQHANTLMRKAVTKPAGSFKRQVKAHGSTDALIRTSATVAPKRSIGVLNTKRLAHAKQVAKSSAVKRFHQPASPAFIPVTITKSSVPVSQRPHAAVPHHIPVKHPSGQHAEKATATEALLERALREATSHLEPAPKMSKRRMLSKRASSLAAVLVALVILGGFVVSQNLPAVRLKLASSKAGFSANLPDYKPAGYHLSNLNSAPGQVSLNFASNSDSRSFAITEKSSDWDSDTLRDTYLASSGQDYQTVESAGRTLYVYGKNAATWVSGGIWYQINTNGALSTRQLVNLASSL
ncbi:MAG TPA: hypothetical protein VHB72_00525 [Candidatus Saccharimonadales bacterium]|nr:hypothetical protein [Candidatus Saccharimonadales bacterium]